MLNRLLIGLFTNGHILLKAYPAGKNTDYQHVARVLHLDFHRIQFTPDLLPADLVAL
jgi:MoxR-like ATPase